MKLKSGRDEIVYLLKRVVEQFELTTGHEVIRNTNRKNYEDIAKTLSEISNNLPFTAEQLDHDKYSPDPNPKNLEYPYRKYDITGGQIKDAFNGIVTNPRPFLIDACYIYLYGTGRKGFEKDPKDPNLLKDAGLQESSIPDILKQENDELRSQLSKHEQEKQELRAAFTRTNKKIRTRSFIVAVILMAGLIFGLYSWMNIKNKWETVRSDMKILPYQPTKTEIDSLEGIWLCYTGSPQARISDPNRYHMVVSNVVDVKYKDGYFTFKRYGASFDHLGYMQFESPWLVSIHSYVNTNNDIIESPRHSLMRLNSGNPYISVISASWSFDVGNKNNIIGIREVYIKQGKGGSVEEVINTIENASCKCKIIRWRQTNGEVKTFNLKNEPLQQLPDSALKKLLDEKSILLREPQEGLIITDTAK